MPRSAGPRQLQPKVIVLGPEEGEELPEPVFYVDGRARRRGPPNTVKRFVDVAGPLWDRAQTVEDARRALDAAHVVWNLMRLPQEARIATGQRLRQEMADGDALLGSTGDFLDMVMRATQYPEDRAIVEVQFQELRPGEWHVMLLTVTAEEVRRAASRAAKPRARRRR